MHHFLQEDIETLQKMLQEATLKVPETHAKLLVLPIYAALPPEAQMRVIFPPLHYHQHYRSL